MKTIGIIGGGQLGMMLAEEAHRLGARAICLDPNPQCPASYVCEECIVSEYDGMQGLKELGDKSDVITYEFENVPSEQLKFIQNTYHIPQGIEPLFDSQNRLREKTNAQKLGLETPQFAAVYTKEDLTLAIRNIGYPCVYKTATMGYDGHGQVILRSEADIPKVEPYLNKEGILEEFIPFDYETSIIMVRDKNEIISFPMTVNIHKNGILDLCIAEEPKPIFERIRKASEAFMVKAGYFGILTVEYFVSGDRFYFNEMAPRPHNSGHYTIEGCTTNQYRELARFLLEMPLEKPVLKAPAVMKNILGFDYENMKRLKDGGRVHIHDYHKSEVRPQRKMAHITFTATTEQQYKLMYKNLFCKEE